MLSTSLLNLTISNLALNNIVRGPFLTFNSFIQLSIFHAYINRLFNPFFYNYYNSYTQLKVSFSSFKQGLEPVFIIGDENLNTDRFNFTNKEFKKQENVACCYAFFGCCSFIDVSTAIFSSSSSYTVKIKRCQFTGKGSDIQLISLPKNEQLIIEDSYFSINSGSCKGSKGLFIYSESQSSKHLTSEISVDDKFSISLVDRSVKSNLLNYFSISRSFFELEGTVEHNGETRDSISSTALFHDINDINMTNIALQYCSWGCCLGLNTEAMIRITFSKFVNNSGKNLIWIWNLPDVRYQKFSYNYLLNNDVDDSLIFVDKFMFIDNCFFFSRDNTKFAGFGSATYSFLNTRFTDSISILPFNLSQLDISICSPSDPTSTPTPPPTITPPPTTTAPPQKSSKPTDTPLQSTPLATQTPTRTPWPTMTPMPSSTPTATPPYIPIAGISAAVIFALCLIIFLIVFLCREYRHKSSEDTINDNNLNVNLSGVGEKSSSSETDPLDLNTSSDDSFII